MNLLYCILFNQHKYQISEIIYLVILDLQRKKLYIPWIQLLVHGQSILADQLAGWMQVCVSQAAHVVQWKGTGVGARRSDVSSVVSLGKSLSLYNSPFFYL